MGPSGITPVTVLTGFLGSGKSTLVNRIVADPRFADTAVVVNEWGEAPIDHALIRAGGENVVVLAGSCICCRVAGEVVSTLRELHFQRAQGSVPHFSRVVIETTGLADPAPLLATLVEMPLVAARYSLAGVVATVAAPHAMATLDTHAESVKQAAMADRIVVTKADAIGAEALDALRARLHALNPGARLLVSRHADIDPALLMDAGLYHPALPLDAAGWLNDGAYRHAGAAQAARHDPRISSFVWRAEEPLRWEDVEAALRALVELHGNRMLRMKGFVKVAGEPGPRAIHAVQHTLYPSARLPSWPDADRATRIVFIGRDLEESPVAQMLETLRIPVPPPRPPWLLQRLPTKT